MAVFATADFGASAGISVLVLIAWATVLVLVVVGFIRGKRLFASGLPKDRKYGLLLILASAFTPLFCWLAPPHVVRMIYGNYPIGSYPSNKIKEGMSTDEVAALLGSPHERFQREDGENWYYWIDSFSIHWFSSGLGQKDEWLAP